MPCRERRAGFRRQSLPLLDAGLAVVGMPVRQVLVLLAGCGTIGAAVYAVGGGGRRLLEAFEAAAVRS
jgi:hypothetical protein